jgi:catechol 2,3-dioxygenase-like lactoylglutathione lyase family enzyme
MFWRRTSGRKLSLRRRVGPRIQMKLVWRKRKLANRRRILLPRLKSEPLIFHIKFFLPYKGEDGHPDLWGFGDGKRAFFWLKQGKPDPAAIHWGFKAEDQKKVDEFYKAAMSSGARDNISPRARLEYYPGYYAADVFDPDGYSFEVVHKS